MALLLVDLSWPINPLIRYSLDDCPSLLALPMLGYTLATLSINSTFFLNIVLTFMQSAISVYENYL